VREFFSANAAYWISEFHLDGLRLDATQQMYDASPDSIHALLCRSAREAAQGRATYLVAENEPQQVHLIRPPAAGGCGWDALWNDDFHHSATVALTGRSEAYFSDYLGAPQEFISMAKRGFLFQGQWFSWQRKRRGSPTQGIDPEQFINFLQNHDQVANSLRGARLHQLTSPGRYRALTALLLLGPGTPMLFQGQEFGTSAPFLYFADHRGELARLVTEGRREFLSQFETIASPETKPVLSDPDAAETFLRCKLDFTEREKHRVIYQLHRDLLNLRRQDPVLSSQRFGGVDGAVLGVEAFALRYFGQGGEDRLLLVNLGRDLHLRVAPEPLLAPLEGRSWRLLWSSEAPEYGGCGTAPVAREGEWVVPGQAAVLLT